MNSVYELEMSDLVELVREKFPTYIIEEYRFDFDDVFDYIKARSK